MRRPSGDSASLNCEGNCAFSGAGIWKRTTAASGGASRKCMTATASPANARMLTTAKAGHPTPRGRAVSTAGAVSVGARALRQSRCGRRRYRQHAACGPAPGSGAAGGEWKRGYRRKRRPVRVGFSTAARVSEIVSPPNDCRPVSISYSTTPKDQISDALVRRRRAPAPAPCRPPCPGSRPPPWRAW